MRWRKIGEDTLAVAEEEMVTGGKGICSREPVVVVVVVRVGVLGGCRSGKRGSKGQVGKSGASIEPQMSAMKGVAQTMREEGGGM